MKLYEYQKNVLEACKKDPSHSQLISMPTGTGKTITFLSLAKELNKKTLIIVHREELLKQTYEKAKLCGFKEEEISLVTAEKKEEFKKLNIAMVQSLSRNIEKYKPEDIQCIIVDEAHHATANSYVNVINFFKTFEEEKHLFGFTATPLRGDKDHLGKVFLSHSFKMTLSEATRLGYIVPVQGMRVEMQKSLKDLDSQQGDYDISQLDKVMNCDAINSLVVERCMNLKKTPAIIFCTSVNHAEELSRRLREKKRRAISVSHKTPKKTLERIFNLLNQGRLEFITNAVKLSEGFDHPPIQSVVLARPTRSPVLYKQMIGRGLRNYPDKYDCFVLEFTSNDPKMMKWEDIDETATFQSGSLEQRKSEKEAMDSYKAMFHLSDNIEVLDVRVSHFEFYECRLRRTVKYKNFYFVPFDRGFAFYELKKSSRKEDGGGNYFNLHAGMFFWKDHLKSFYAWGEYDFLMNPHGSQPINAIRMAINYYSKLNKFGKWYPSDKEPTTRQQKILMEKLGMKWNKITSARKAEIEIENKVIIKAIEKYLSKGLFSGVMEIF